MKVLDELYIKYDEMGRMVLPKDPALAWCNVVVDHQYGKNFYITKRYLRYNITKGHWEESEKQLIWTKVIYVDGDLPVYPPAGLLKKIKRFLWRLW